nr:uncharacterized protein LOC127489882 [Oryctolagus cuniculus]
MRLVGLRGWPEAPPDLLSPPLSSLVWPIRLKAQMPWESLEQPCTQAGDTEEATSHKGPWSLRNSSQPAPNSLPTSRPGGLPHLNAAQSLVGNADTGARLSLRERNHGPSLRAFLFYRFSPGRKGTGRAWLPCGHWPWGLLSAPLAENAGKRRSLPTPGHATACGSRRAHRGVLGVKETRGTESAGLHRFPRSRTSRDQRPCARSNMPSASGLGLHSSFSHPMTWSNRAATMNCILLVMERGDAAVSCPAWSRLLQRATLNPSAAASLAKASHVEGVFISAI